MKPILLAALLAPAFFAFTLPMAAQAQNRQQALVDRSTLALEEMLSAPNANGRQDAMRQARAVMVCPQIFRAGFVLGGSGGDCVLAARDGGGSWSYPAFYAMGSGSFGLQAGIQDSEFIMMILTSKGLSAIMDSQFKFGADASVAVATIGAGVEGDTTSALHADIVAYSKTRGLFAGVALNGSILTTDTAWNRAYYGFPLAARQIVLQMQANNPGANPLREMLTKYGATSAVPAYASRYASPPQRPYDNDAPQDSAPYATDSRGSVSQQALPPPR